MRRKDTNEQIAELLRAVTGTKNPRGEDLLGSPELKRQLREAKAREKARTKRKTKA